jgi:hypothetical protein
MDEVAQLRQVWRPSASGIDRSEACELSAVLPRPPEAPKAHNAPASRGDRIHAALERRALGARPEDVKAMMLPWDLPDFDEVVKYEPVIRPIDGWPTAEVEMWINPYTGECKLGVANVPVDEGFWRGRADRIGYWEHPVHGWIPAVEDHKTGNPDFQIDGTAKQLGYFIVGTHIMLEAPLIAGIAWLTKDPTHPRVHVWTADEIVERFRGMRDHEMRLRVLERNTEVPAANPSQKNCKWCPARPVCPYAYGKKADGGNG